MKKSIIAAGAASVALAAMPVVGVFADDPAPDPTVDDKIQVTVTSGCAIADAVAEKTVAFSVAPGNEAESTPAGSISIVCTGINYKVTAVAGGTTTDKENYLIKSGSPAGEIAPMGTTGATSTWAYRVSGINTTGGTAPSLVTDKDKFHAVPTTAENLATGTAATTATINTQYKVSTDLSLPAGVYEGKVIYTVAENS